MRIWSDDRSEVQAGRLIGSLLPEEEWNVWAIGTYPAFKDCGDKAQPDIVIQHKPTNQWVVFEVDEHYHRPYDTSCEWKKVLGHFQSILATDNATTAHFIRFNPDNFANQPSTFPKTLEAKLHLVIQC